jgi:hypothetical protein
VVLGTLFGGACYRYVPVEMTAVRPTEDVRLRVSEAAAARLVREFGTYLTELEGQFAREGTDSVSIKVPISRGYRGLSLESGHQTLFLGRSEVVGLRRRQFSRERTMLAGAGAIVAFSLLALAVTQLGEPNSEVEESPPPPPPQGAILFRFRIP